MTTITISVFDNLNPTSPVQDVTVRIYNQSGDTFETQLITDSAGQITYDIPDGTYWVRFYKRGYFFESKTLIVVDAAETNVWDVTANDLTELPPSRAAGICRVSGFVIDAQGAPSHLPILTFALPQDVRVMGGSVIGTEKVVTQPNSDGYVEVELIQDVVYNVTMASISDEVLKVKVPKTQACSITSLLYPSGKLSATPGSVSVTVGTEYNTGIYVQSTSGISVPDLDISVTTSSLVTITTSSQQIAASINTDNSISILASEAGSYTIEVREKYPLNVVAVSTKLLGTFTVSASA